MNLDNIWYVLRVKAQHELKVVSNLNKMGLKSYTPYIEEIRQWSDRKKKIKKPLISRHVFVQLSYKDEMKVFSSNGVLGYLNLHGNRAKVLDKEINNLKNYCDQKYNQKSFSIGKTIKAPVLGSSAEVVRVDKNNMCSAISECGRYTIKFKLAS